jgi:hypothetical protein
MISWLGRRPSVRRLPSDVSDRAEGRNNEATASVDTFTCLNADRQERRANAPCRPATILVLGVGVSLLVLVLTLGAAGQAADDFYALMDGVMARMHVAMHVAPSGDPDRDFATMMVAHHQGAVDMALLELRFGKDERLRRLAQGIIIEQRQEIQVMRSILEQRQ